MAQMLAGAVPEKEKIERKISRIVLEMIKQKFMGPGKKKIHATIPKN